MDKESQRHAVEALRDWSKWLIGTDVVAAIGCVVVLQAGVSGVAGVFLVLAIAAFSLSVCCALLLVLALVSLEERLPLTEPDGTPRSIYRHRPAGRISVAQLATGQLLLLILGAVFFLTWIVL